WRSKRSRSNASSSSAVGGTVHTCRCPTPGSCRSAGAGRTVGTRLVLPYLTLFAQRGSIEPVGPGLGGLERALLGPLGSRGFPRLLVESVSRLFRAVTGVWLVHDGNVLVEHITTAPRSFPAEPTPFGQGVAGSCAAARRGLLVNEYPASSLALPHYVRLHIRHSMAHPLLMGDELFGVLSISRFGDDREPFTPEEVASIEPPAGFAAPAPPNARASAQA